MLINPKITQKGTVQNASHPMMFSFDVPANYSKATGPDEILYLSKGSKYAIWMSRGPFIKMHTTV